MKHLKECSFCHKKVYKLAAPSRGLCANCYYREKRNGTPEYQDRARKPCSIGGCESLAIAKGLCDLHYRRFLKEGDPQTERVEKWGIKRSHPLRHTWGWTRKAGRIPAWDDFWVFAAAVGERPAGCKLSRLLPREPFGPENFEWRQSAIASGSCREGRAAWARASRAANPEQWKNYDLRKLFGITLDDYKRMLEEQGGVCAICKGPEPVYKYFPVDHCHTTGRVRGLLCSHCNKGLGSFKDSADALQAAIEYLKRYPVS